MAHSPTPDGGVFSTTTTTTATAVTPHPHSASTGGGLFTSSVAPTLYNSSRRRSPSPQFNQQQLSQPQQQQPLSKRDKRRAQIEQRLKEIASSFSRDRDVHTRTQLNALSRDMQFVARADVYANKPLDDGPDDLVLALASANGIGGETETKVALGPTAARFVNDVNNEMERRDALITEVDLRYRAEAEALAVEYDFALQVAHAEHDALRELARQRVVSSVHVRRRAIQREKDQLDTADSTFLMNAHALTALAAPGSPSSGLAGGARKTRYSRLRPDHDESAVDGGNGSNANQSSVMGGSNGNNGGGNGNGVGSGPSGGGLGGGGSTGGIGSSKRKRKAPHGNGDPDESPGLSSRSAPYASLSSLLLWDAKGRPDADGFGGSGGANIPPASAPERFFTARELKAASATAHASVAQAWTDKRLRKHLSILRGSGGGVGASNVSALDLTTGGTGGAGEDNSDDEADATATVDYSTLVAPAMDRSGSHATRSTRLNQQQAAEPPPTVTAEGLEEMDDPRRIFGLAALEAAQVRSKVSGTKDVEAPLTGGMSAGKVAEDLAIIQSLMEAP